MTRLLIKNGLVFYRGKFQKVDILCEGENIKKIGKNINKEMGEDIINAKGLIVLPGLIDPHVHLREPGWTQKEDFRTGTEAAAKGGYTTVIDMPNNKVPTITQKRLEEKRKLAKKKGIVDIFFHFGATKNNYEEVKKTDALSLKIYMGETTGELLVDDDESIKKHMLSFHKDRIIVFHAEDQEEIEKAKREGKERDKKAVIKGVKRVVKLANELKRKVHIAHVSTKEEIEIIEKSRYVSFEVAPHYLFLWERDRGFLKKYAGVNPPLRKDKDIQRLWEEIDKIKIIGSDHAPHLPEEKENGAKGFTGLETTLSLFLDVYNKGRIKLEWIPKALAENPAKRFGLKDRGKIETGLKADFSIIDVKKEWIVKGEELRTKCKWTPYEGRRLKGKNIITVYRSKIIYS